MAQPPGLYQQFVQSSFFRYVTTTASSFERGQPQNWVARTAQGCGNVFSGVMQLGVAAGFKCRDTEVGNRLFGGPSPQAKVQANEHAIRGWRVLKQGSREVAPAVTAVAVTVITYIALIKE